MQTGSAATVPEKPYVWTTRFLMASLLCVSRETVEPRRVVDQQFALQGGVGRKARDEVHQIGFIRLMRRIRVWEVGAPEHAVRRRIHDRAGNRDRLLIGRHRNA